MKSSPLGSVIGQENGEILSSLKDIKFLTGPEGA